jgi:hypothetical protein
MIGQRLLMFGLNTGVFFKDAIDFCEAIVQGTFQWFVATFSLVRGIPAFLQIRLTAWGPGARLGCRRRRAMYSVNDLVDQ